MDEKQPRVSLRKTQSASWTDPVTGEIYPGGDPNPVPQPISQNNFAQPQRNFAQNISVVPPNNAEVYPNNSAASPVRNRLEPGMKFCKFCGEQIPMEAVLCVKCGRQVEQLQGMTGVNPQVVINNAPQPVVYQTGTPKDKWVAFVLCLLFGVFGAHCFYEGRVGAGVLRLFTFGLFGIGWLVDLIIILSKPNPYYV